MTKWNAKNNTDENIGIVSMKITLWHLHHKASLCVKSYSSAVWIPQFKTILWRCHSFITELKTPHIGLSGSMYRVAQNKIPHQTICNISATSGPILKILVAALFWHFSESNGVQCIHCTLIIQVHYRVKQLLWKFSQGIFGNTRIIMTSLARRDVKIIKLLTFYKFVTC